jgi:hypothetical protein
MDVSTEPTGGMQFDRLTSGHHSSASLEEVLNRRLGDFAHGVAGEGLEDS